VKTSLILSTYNWPEALDLCLKSIMLQTMFPDEILIADDGSTSSTLEIIKKHQKILQYLFIIYGMKTTVLN
jgi:glycosyltransferase involved in cell wall biosynthesis